jgi:hypothetical protein
MVRTSLQGMGKSLTFFTVYIVYTTDDNISVLKNVKILVSSLARMPGRPSQSLLSLNVYSMNPAIYSEGVKTCETLFSSWATILEQPSQCLLPLNVYSVNPAIHSEGVQ